MSIGIQRLILTIFFMLSCFALSSCTWFSINNKVYFDLQSQAIVACDGSIIRKISITNLKTYKLTTFRVDYGSDGVQSFSLKNLNKSFFEDNLFDTTEFKLEPYSTYEIENRSHYHVASQKLLIKTNRNGYVTYADILKCN